MQNRSRLLVAGSITLLLGLVIFFPARVAYQWFAPDAIAVAGIDGSVWSGRAREARVNGIYLRDLSWRLRPQSLFTGKMGYVVEARPSSGFVEGSVAIGVTGKVTLSNLTASMPLESLQQLVALPGLRGVVNLAAPEGAERGGGFVHHLYQTFNHLSDPETFDDVRADSVNVHTVR